MKSCPPSSEALFSPERSECPPPRRKAGAGPAARAARVADPFLLGLPDRAMVFGGGPADAQLTLAKPVDLGSFIADPKKRMKNTAGGARWRRVP